MSETSQYREEIDYDFFPSIAFGSKKSSLDLSQRACGRLRHPIQPPAIPDRKEGLWQITETPMTTVALENEQWFAERSRRAMLVLYQCVELNPEKLGGVPLLRGTRFSISQLLSEIAGGDSIVEIAENFDIAKSQIQEFLQALAVFLDKPSV